MADRYNLHLPSIRRDARPSHVDLGNGAITQAFITSTKIFLYLDGFIRKVAGYLTRLLNTANIFQLKKVAREALSRYTIKKSRINELLATFLKLFFYFQKASSRKDVDNLKSITVNPSKRLLLQEDSHCLSFQLLFRRLRYSTLNILSG